MATAQRLSTDESHCVLCCEHMEFSACGSCDHPICLKCCLRLRLLRKEYDCPVCRAQLKDVVVSKGYKSWSDKSSKPRPKQHSRNYGIHHETAESQAKVDELLEHKCSQCGDVFRTFPQVKDHIRKFHSLMYCDICLRHLKLFTHERKCYTREALVRHRKEGDADDRSHRGHPSCQFCDERYLDNDELLSHLRKNHFWCHLCEKDGSQDYYPHYKELRRHFKQAHFLCEEGECLHEKFTSVFRVKIDYQAHIAQKHSNRLSKAEARQVRQLDINITFAPRENLDLAGVVSSQDYSFPERGQERYRERSGKMTSGVTGQNMQFGEPRDPGRYKGKEKECETKREARRVTQDGKGKMDVEQSRWTNQENERKGTGNHKGVNRDTKRSLRDVLEVDNKRPPGNVDQNKKRIFEDNSGISSKEAEDKGEKKSGKSKKMAKEAEDVKPKKEMIKKKEDEVHVSGKGKKNDSLSKAIQESNKPSLDEKEDSKDDGRISGKGKKNDASKATLNLKENSKDDSHIGEKGKKNDASKATSNLKEDSKDDSRIGEKRKKNDATKVTSNLKEDSKDDSRIGEKGKKNDASKATLNLKEDSKDDSRIGEKRKKNDATKATSNLKEDSKPAAKLKVKNTSSNNKPQENIDSSKETSVVQPSPNLEEDFPELGKQGSAKNIAKPSPKPTYESEFPTLSNESGKLSNPGPNVRPPPGLAPPGLGGELVVRSGKEQYKQTNSFNSVVDSGQKVEQGNDSYKTTTKSKQIQGEILNVEKSLVKKSAANSKANVQNKPTPKPTYDSEFPTLSTLTNGHKTNMKAPPGLAPPGFQPGIQSCVRPPPGMGWTVPLNMPSANSSTKDSRNQKLISDVRRILNLRGESFESFRAVSGSYRQGNSSPETYYQQCCELLGVDHIHKVFRELIDLLPDEEKQKQLLMVYNDARVKAKEEMRADAVPFHMPEESSVKSNTEKAVYKTDSKSLSKPSLEEVDFPALPKTSGKNNKSVGKVPPAWTRGK